MGLTNVGEQVLLNRLFCSEDTGTVNLQLDGTVTLKLVLYTSTEASAGTLTDALLDAMTDSSTNAANNIEQVVGGGTSNYVAQTVTFTSNVGTTEAIATGTNSCDLDSIAEFTTSATGTWGTVTHYGIHISTDAVPTAATCVFVGEWTDAAVVNAGDTVQVAAGALGLKITAS